jgi:hypothetical protein
VGYEPTIPVFERAKTFHTLDPSANVIGNKQDTMKKFRQDGLVVRKRKSGACVIHRS